MGQACEVCGKKPQMGNQITTRGRAKYLGGVGTKTTGISRRQFKPNLRSVRVTTANGTHKTVRVCARCLRSGTVTKVVRNAPFKLPAAIATEKAKLEKASAKPVKAETKPKKLTAEQLEAKGYKVRKRKRKKEDAEG
jgi:large subunit ribosomal protein L28